MKVNYQSESQHPNDTDGDRHHKNASRARAGHKRLSGVRHLASLFLLEAIVFVTAAGVWGGSWMRRVHGTTRPDVWELFGEHSQVSLQAWRQGWLSIQPVNLLSGADLSSYNQRDEILQMQKTCRPRLVIMEFPVPFWKQLSRVNPSTNGGRQRLKRLREKHRPFLSLTEDVAAQQLAGGDVFFC